MSCSNIVLPLSLLEHNLRHISGAATQLREKILSINAYLRKNPILFSVFADYVAGIHSL